MTSSNTKTSQIKNLTRCRNKLKSEIKETIKKEMHEIKKTIKRCEKEVEQRNGKPQKQESKRNLGNKKNS
jgi:hypothetical protein